MAYTMRRIGLIAAVVVVAVALLWIGSEMHYGNCVDAAKASTTPPRDARPPGTRGVFDDGDPGDSSREVAIDACSHLPF